METIQQLMESVRGSMTLPRLRFFEPNEEFWSVLEDVQNEFDIDMFIDCGTGNGDLPAEAIDRNIKMAGIDIIKREGNNFSDVQIIPAHKIPSNPSVWRMVCRPNHSGWVEPLLEQSLQEDSGFIYVGLNRNIHIDLDDVLELYKFDMFTSVGEDNEIMLVFYPQ